MASRRTYFVRDRYLGDFQDFPSLKQAAKYAMRASDCDADDVGKCIFVERDESYVPLYQASPAAVHMISSYLHRNPMRRNCCNPLPYEHAARLIDPGEVIRGTYRRKNVKGGTIGLLFGKVRRFGPMKLASVHFRAAHFTPAQARSWMRDHRLKPILFEAASGARQAAWQQESVRAKRSAACGRKGRQRRRVA